uniref:RING-type E3 ubiquitin transferase n=1 Tax=Medicago truncatula TaxID=3880 RepID=I3S0E8_MEDTR|nr:unknown [Medicago truncatula]
MSSGATHWCYECNRPIVLEGRDVVCPYCDEGFVQELNEMRGTAPQNTFPSRSGEFNQMPDLFDAIHAFVGHRGSDNRFGLMDAVDNFMRHRMAGMHPNFDVRGRSSSVPVPEQGWGVYSSGPFFSISRSSSWTNLA